MYTEYNEYTDIDYKQYTEITLEKTNCPGRGTEAHTTQLRSRVTRCQRGWNSWIIKVTFIVHV